MREWTKATTDFETILKLYPDDSSAKAAMAEITVAILDLPMVDQSLIDG